MRGLPWVAAALVLLGAAPAASASTVGRQEPSGALFSNGEGTKENRLALTETEADDVFADTPGLTLTPPAGCRAARRPTTSGATRSWPSRWTRASRPRPRCDPCASGASSPACARPCGPPATAARPTASARPEPCACPAGVSAAAGCRSGVVSVQVKRGRRTISTRRARIGRTCTFSCAVTFRWLGSALLAPRAARAVAVRAG